MQCTLNVQKVSKYIVAVLRQHTHALEETDAEERKLLNKVVISVLLRTKSILIAS